MHCIKWIPEVQAYYIYIFSSSNDSVMRFFKKWGWGGEEIKFRWYDQPLLSHHLVKIHVWKYWRRHKFNADNKSEDFFLMELKCQLLLTPYCLVKQPLFQQLQPGIFESFLILFYPLINIWSMEWSQILRVHQTFSLALSFPLFPSCTQLLILLEPWTRF